MSENEKQSEANEKQLDEILELFKRSEEAESEIRQQALEDLRFRAGEQWPENLKREREHDLRPCLVINKMPQFVRQVTNDQKLNRSSIRVSPVDDKGDVETAKIINGLIRHIENSSNADVAFDTAFEGAATGGFGYFRVITDYCDERSFNQEIQIKRIDNHFSVFFDPSSVELDGSDANFAFITDEVSKEEFEALYPDAELSSMEDWTSIGNARPDWITKDSVRIAECFIKKYEQKNLLQFPDGAVYLEDEVPEQFQGLQVKTRKTMVPVIHWYKINGHEILEETIWPGKWIPIVPVYGEKLNVDGKKIFESVIRHAKDSQKMYNYWASSETETITLAPRAPYIVADGQVPPEFEKFWQSANRKNHAYLPYVPVSSGGQLVGPPQRNAYEAPIAAITSARMQSSDDIKATTGIYDASLGARSNEQSGVAIQRRNIQAQTSNYHFINNLNISKKHCARILIDLIPKIYDTPQAVRIIGEDDQQKIVLINQFFQENGKQVMYDVRAGKYDVVIETGPSFATKRQEAASMMIEMTKAMPQLAQVAGDIIVGNMDWPGASELQERIRKTMPPNLIDSKGDKDLPPEVMAQMQQMQMMVDQLSQQLNQQTEIVKQKRLELESKERIEFAKLNAQLEIARAQIESKEAIEGLNASMTGLEDDIMMMKQRLGLLSIEQPIYESGSLGAVPQQNQMPTGGPETLG